MVLRLLQWVESVSRLGSCLSATMGSALVKYIVELPWGRCQWFSCFFTCEHKAMCVQDMNLKCQVAVMLLGCLECQLSTVLQLKPRNCTESLALGLKLTRHLRGWCVPIITCPWATTMSCLLLCIDGMVQDAQGNLCLFSSVRDS